MTILWHFLKQESDSYQKYYSKIIILPEHSIFKIRFASVMSKIVALCTAEVIIKNL